MSGGFEYLSGGTATGTVVASGGYQLIEAGGTTTGTMVSNGGTEVVFSGGAAKGAGILSGGTEVVHNGSLASGTTFGSGGLLDLADVTFSGTASASVDANDLLTVMDGTGTRYTQQLAGSYAPGQFRVSDGSGDSVTDTIVCFCTGTLIRAVRDGVVTDVAVEALRDGGSCD